MSDYILEGTGVPVLKFKDGAKYELPEPIGEGKKGLRDYNFTKYVRDSFLSEENVNIEIGVSYSFDAAFNWISLSKEALDRLFKAQNDNYVIVRLNEEREDIEYEMRVDELKHNFFEGNVDHPAGYSVSVRFITIKHLTASGYAQLVGGSGFGSDYGSQGGTPY